MGGILSVVCDKVLNNSLLILIMSAGVLLTVKTRAVQVRCFKKSFKYLFKNDGGEGEISPFGALCTSLSATIGTGNIVGVATAISAGGPGALFWMIVSALLGMATKYAEGLLAVKYRRFDKDGKPLGGPFYYIEDGLKEVSKLKLNWKPLGKAFALFGALAGLMGIGTITQVNGITEAAERIFNSRTVTVFCGKPITVSVLISGTAVTVLSAVIIVGGTKRIAKASEIIVPIMALSYIVFSLIIIICNIKKIPWAAGLILKCAVNPQAVGGAVVGISLKNALKIGVGRGIFSNEAGLGSAPIAAASAKTDSPSWQGLVTMTGTFIDTIVICTITGLSVIVTGAWSPSVTGRRLEGFNITAYAWQTGLPFKNDFCVFILSGCLIFFAFTTIIGWNCYYEKCVEYLLGGYDKKTKTAFTVLYILSVAVGPFMTVTAVWKTADIFNCLMALPNLLALILLRNVVKSETLKI